MIRLKVIFNREDSKRIRNAATAIDRAINAMIFSSEGQLAKSGDMYINQVRNDILRGRRGRAWKSWYRKWRSQPGVPGGLNYWNLSGSVLRNLTRVRPLGRPNVIFAGLMRNTARTYTSMKYYHKTRSIRQTSGTWYARLLEYGAILRNRGGLGVPIVIPARPLFEPAFRRVLPAIRGMWIEEFRNLLRFWR